MIGHPAPLAPPPPRANPEEAPLAPAAALHAPVTENDALANLQASLTAPTDLTGSPDEQTTLQQTADADGSERGKKEHKEFLAYCSDITFGPNHEQGIGTDLRLYGEALVKSRVLPPFAISENTALPLNLAPDTGRDKAQYMLTKLRDNYFTLKA